LIAARKKKHLKNSRIFLDAVDRIVGGLEKKNKIITHLKKRKPLLITKPDMLLHLGCWNMLHHWLK
jgi:hypothetical protein